MINSDNVLLPSQKKKKVQNTNNELQNSMMSESSLPQKNANCMIPLIWKQAKFIYGEINPFIMGQVQRLIGKGNERTFSGDRNVVHFDRCLGYTGRRICQSSSNGRVDLCISLM